MHAQVRRPAVAGHFYPASPDDLRQAVAKFVQPGPEKIQAYGCIVPHAGYVYSGQVAGAVYARLKLPRHFIILCPNHTGEGEAFAIMSQGSWLTPLGEVLLDTELAEELKRELPLLREDAAAHLYEHAVEVQIPFLQENAAEFSFVPIAVGVGRLDALTALGTATARVLRSRPERDVLVIASSDMNHYESDARTRVKDRLAIDKVLALDPRGLWETVQRERISMCGFGPAVAMLTAALQLGASQAELVKYATSADVSGDRDRVVGYAGIIVS